MAPGTDLVVFTMGGNDAGFSTIVQSCFVSITRTAAACRSAVDAAHALIPTIRERLIADVAALRAGGLRADARIMQLGYPWLQLATVPAAVNVGHPGQMVFVDGVTTKFSGHEPDAQLTNPQAWINEAFSGADTNLWYHPNDAGHTAYAELLLAQGTWVAPTHGATPTPAATPRAALRVRPVQRQVSQGRPVTLRVRVRLSDDTAPRVRERVRVRVIAR